MQVKCNSHTGIETLSVYRASQGQVATRIKCGNGVVGSVWMNPETARQVARELNRLADDAEDGACHQSPS